MMLFHGSNVEIANIELGKCRPWKDFGKGFYLTDIPEQAMRMAKRVVRIYGGEPVVTYFEADMDDIFKSDMSIRAFEGPSKEWAVFVMNNRSQTFTDRTSPECNLLGQYDVVIGPVADDDLALLFRQFQEGLISVDVLTREMTFRKLTNQYSFHTQRAVGYLKKAGVLI